MKGKTLKQITNTPKAGLKELSALPDNEEFNVEIISKDSGKVYTVSTDAFNSNISGSSALLPNGIKQVGVSRDLQADDAGYVLILEATDVDKPIVLNIPYPSPLSVNESFGLVINNADFLICGYSSIPDGLTLVTPALNENVLFTTTATGGGNYTFPVSTAVFEDKTAIRYLYDKSQNAIPLSGTLAGSPVTGIIYVRDDLGDYGMRRQNTDNITQVGFSGLSAVINYVDLSNNEFAQITVDNNGIFIEDQLSGISRGIQSSNDYSANITDLDYTQKKYVDNQIITLDYGDIATVGGVQNIQVYTTGTGTGTASVDLLPNIQIGKDVTVSDLGNNAGTHNIQIDAGVGNTILVAGGSPSQDITLNTNGASVTLRKMTATQFMVIAKN